MLGLVGSLFAAKAQPVVKNYPNTSGTIDITPSALTSLGCLPAPGDTLLIPNGTFTCYGGDGLQGTSSNYIVIKASPNTIFHILGFRFDNVLTNTKYIKFLGGTVDTCGNSQFAAIQHGCKNLTWESMTFLKHTGAQRLFQFYENTSSLNWNGNRNSTLDSMKFHKCIFNGEENGQFINAGNIDNALPALNSICLDWEVDSCTFKNLTTTGVSPTCIEAKGAWGWKIHDNNFDSLNFVVPINTSIHLQFIVIYGDHNDIYNNRFAHARANAIRLFPITFNAINYNAGTVANRANKVYNNIRSTTHNYPMVEVNPNNQAGWISNSGGVLTYGPTQIYFNTDYSTTKEIYTGRLVDLVNLIDTVTIAHNVIILPEKGTTYSPSTNAQYLITASGRNAIDTFNNKVFPTLAAAGVIDTIGFLPLANSLLTDAATTTAPIVSFDIYNTSRPQGSARDIGSVERTNASNVPPVANAGVNQIVNLPTTSATLDGSASSDPDGTITIYAWVRTSGPNTPTIVSPSSAITNVTGMIAGTYVFTLTVTDNNSATNSATTQVIINIPPVASITTSDTLVILNTTTITLNGSGSNDPDGSIASYSWSKLSGIGSTITSPTSSSTTITGLSLGVYRFQLSVTDNRGAVTSTTIRITVLPNGTFYFNEKGTLIYDSGGLLKVSYSIKIAKNNRGQVLGYVDYSTNTSISPVGIYTSFINPSK